MADMKQIIVAVHSVNLKGTFTPYIDSRYYNQQNVGSSEFVSYMEAAGKFAWGYPPALFTKDEAETTIQKLEKAGLASSNWNAMDWIPGA